MILAIDTSTTALSVAIGNREGETNRQNWVDDGVYIHAERLLPVVDELLQTSGIDKHQLEAVAFSGGPGSYTGLRIGASTAKAIAHAAGIPILPVDTCEVLAQGAVRRGDAKTGDHIYAALDARRMEVFTAGFRVTPASSFLGLERLGKTQAAVLDGVGAIPPQEAFPQLDENACALWVGDGALKLQKTLSNHAHWKFLEAMPEAQDVLTLAAAQWAAGHAADLAYYEPAYLKDFAAALPKNPLGLGELTEDRLPKSLRS
ncbi:MAG: tRNA (adenosine(37)-N6)-threonylcarbamoyltransferase complex dimerization subunit type 1 TsaB [Flavobacteriales bacterium]